MSFRATILDIMKVLSKQVNGCQGDGFSSVGAQTRCHKICNGYMVTGLVAPISCIAGLLTLYL